MPSASNGKPEKAASSEAPETPIRQIMTIIEHKIRNLEKRKSKLTSYRDLQKSGKDLNPDQKIAVAKYDEVAQTLEFARDLSKQVASIAIVAERDAKKQAKKDAWVRSASDTGKVREVLLILDCLSQMGNPETRQDFLNGDNGAAKLTPEDLKVLDELYPEVTPKHEINEDGVSGFSGQIAKAAEHLYSIIDGKPKDVFGTTYTHIKQIITTVNECGYFDKGPEIPEPEPEPELVPELEEESIPAAPEQQQIPSPTVSPVQMYPMPPAAVVPAPAYPMRPVAHMTLQEIEHAYFSQQYPQQRPIAEVIGSHDFYFLQESELDSPVGTPQPPPAAIPTQTFTNQHYVPMEPPIHMPPHFAPVPHHPPPEYVALPPAPPLQPPPHPLHLTAPPPPPAVVPVDSPRRSNPDTPVAEVEDEDWKENGSPERDDNDDKSKEQVQSDAKKRFRRYGRGPSSSFRGRGNFHSRQNNDGYQGRQNNDGYQGRQNNDGYQSRQNNDGYQSRQNNDGYQSRQNNDGYQSRQHNDGYNRQNNDGYQSRQHNDGYQSRHNDYRSKDGYQSRQYNDSYQNRHKDSYQNRNDNYYGNGDAGHQQENGGSRSRFESGYRHRGPRARGGPRGRAHFARKAPAADSAE